MGGVNQGALALRRAEPGHGAGRRIARRIGVDEPRVSRWLSGKLKPSPELRAKLEDEYSINWRLWDLPADEPGSEQVAHG